jgi:hypothetical protein
MDFWQQPTPSDNHAFTTGTDNVIPAWSGAQAQVMIATGAAYRIPGWQPAAAISFTISGSEPAAAPGATFAQHPVTIDLPRPTAPHTQFNNKLVRDSWHFHPGRDCGSSLALGTAVGTTKNGITDNVFSN